MEVSAIAKFIRIAPRKVAIITNLIKGERVDDALNILKFLNKRGAKIVKKVLLSAVANASNNHKMDVDNAYVKAAFVGEGPTLKRYLPRAMGRATRINKRTSHITVIVAAK